MLKGPGALLAMAGVVAFVGCGAAASPGPDRGALSRLALRVSRDAVPIAAGDVDGDGRGDVALVAGTRDWLLTSRGGPHLTVLEHPVRDASGAQGQEVVALGDGDGDRMADLALPSDRGTEVVLFGRRTWPARVDLRAAAGRASAVVAGGRRTSGVGAVARQGAALLLAPSCYGTCELAVVRVAFPQRGSRVSLGDSRLPALTPPAGRRLVSALAPWGTGAEPVFAWSTVEPEDSTRTQSPLVGTTGTAAVVLGRREELLGLTHTAALVGTASDAPPGEAVQEGLRLYHVAASERPVALTAARDPDLRGTMSSAGRRCLLVSGWGNTPATVWLLDAGSFRTLMRWQPRGARAVGAAVARDALTLVALDAAGQVSRHVLRLPAECA